MSELKTTQELHADNDISLAWDEYEKSGEVGNHAENLLHAAEFYQTESKVKDKENQSLIADREGAISLMGPSWKHAASQEPDIMTRYVTMAENQSSKKNKEIYRLAVMAVKQAARANELYVALGSLLDASTRDITEDELHLVCEIARKIHEKSRIEAEQDND